MLGGVEVSVGRRERKKLGTHRALRSAALRLVAERGLEHVTVEDIAEAVDVSTRTFFNHFSSKEEAIVGPDPGRLEALRESLDAQPAEQAPLEVLEHVLTEVATAMLERQEERMLQIQVARDNPGLIPRQLAAFAEFERALVQEVAARTGTDPDRDVYPSVAAAAAVAALRASLTVWRNNDGSVPLTGLVKSAFADLAAGLAPPRRDGGTGCTGPGPSGAPAAVPGTPRSADGHMADQQQTSRRDNA